MRRCCWFRGVLRLSQATVKEAIGLEILNEGKTLTGVYYLTPEASKKIHIEEKEIKNLSYRIPLNSELIATR